MAKYVRYELGNAARFGMLEGSSITPLNGTIGDFRPTSDPIVDLADVRLLAPTIPGKIIAAGPGYHASLTHIAAPERPIFFNKPLTALNHPEGEIELPPDVPAVHHEAELAIVIGRKAKRVSEAEAADCIFGYTCMNDVVAGDFSSAEAFANSPMRAYGKFYDGFAPIGPCVVTDLDPADLRVQCRVNGEVRQDHRTNDRLFRPETFVSFLSSIMTLLPGDVISTGSPPGVHALKGGDTVEVEIEDIGVLRNYVRAST